MKLNWPASDSISVGAFLALKELRWHDKHSLVADIKSRYGIDIHNEEAKRFIREGKEFMERSREAALRDLHVPRGA